MPFRALIFDFNGNLSNDEHVMEAVTAEVLARHATPPTHREYIDRLAGLSDETMVRTWLGDREDVDAIVAERIAPRRGAHRSGSYPAQRWRRSSR